MNEEVETRLLAPTHFNDEDSLSNGHGHDGRSGAEQDQWNYGRQDTPVPDDLQAVFDVPVKVQAVLGRSRMDIGDLLRLKPGAVVELDRRVGEPVDIFVNNRLIARGEVVLIDSALGVTLTEIVRLER